ncbi:MAG: peptidase dimerization domain-containing protein, partial [Sutterella sp.]|nr:peptidase dimerization domain-containing protein [Sutterella sp.]
MMTAMDIVVRENRPHGDIYVCFVPEEELGEKGARKIDFSKFPVDFAYTIDCCELGEVVWETFNDGNAVLRVKGIPAHPMSAKGVMVNPILVVHDFLYMLDRTQTPECTELREGFVVLKTMQANPTDAVLTMKIRDHSRALYERKKEQLRRAAD